MRGGTLMAVRRRRYWREIWGLTGVAVGTWLLWERGWGWFWWPGSMALTPLARLSSRVASERIDPSGRDARMAQQCVGGGLAPPEVHEQFHGVA